MLKLDKNLQERLYLKTQTFETRVTVKITEQVVKEKTGEKYMYTSCDDNDSSDHPELH